jgi:DNA adenine methylase
MKHSSKGSRRRMLIEAKEEFFSIEPSSEAVRSPLRYPGGKQKAIKIIRRALPVKCTEYREPMVGGGSVFLHAKSVNIAQSYWINDEFSDLIAFWKITQDPHLCSLLRAELEKIRNNFDSAEQVHRFFLEVQHEMPKDEYRAAFLFFFFNRVTFSGTTRAGGFSRAASMTRFTRSSIERLRQLPAALLDTRISNSDFEPVITAPGKDVFLFLDPPYYTASKLYGRNGALHTFDHERLCNTLRKTSHKFLITYDDCDAIRELYSPWASIIPWRLRYGMNNCGKDGLSRLGSELFIANYDISGIL